MEESAVEWFHQQLVDRQNGNGDSRSRDEIFEQAKSIEKAQIENAFYQTKLDEFDDKVWISPLNEQDKEMEKIKNNSKCMRGWDNGFNNEEIKIICKNKKK